MTRYNVALEIANPSVKWHRSWRQVLCYTVQHDNQLVSVTSNPQNLTSKKSVAALSYSSSLKCILPPHSKINEKFEFPEKLLQFMSIQIPMCEWNWVFI